MRKGRVSFTGEEDKRKYVHECEVDFEAQLDDAVHKILEAPRCRIITLSGPTCSGKTTTAKKLISEFTERGRFVHVISIDNFYYDRDVLMKRAEKNGLEIDFDSPDTIDMDELERVIEAIFRGGEVASPVYDFQTGRRLPDYEHFNVTDSDLFVFEGIQAVYPDVTALFAHHPYISVYISVAEPLEVLGEILSPNDIRLFRRLVRDYNFRGSKPDFTFELWKSVRHNEDINIIPYADDCDIVLNSLLDYELCMLKKPLVDVLSTVTTDSPNHKFATETIKFLENIQEISAEYIPENSLYHEFLG